MKVKGGKWSVDELDKFLTILKDTFPAPR